MKEIVFSKTEIAEIEKAVQEAPPMTYTKEFVLFPDDDEKTVVISQIPSGATLKLDKRHAQLLADMLIHQIQTW